MGASKRIGSLIFILAFLVISIYSGPAITGDEPAPVVYIDPETGELRVQNPPKLPREHGPVAQTGSNNQGSKYLYSLGGTFAFVVIALITWMRGHHKKKATTK
jgi:hypothetical protein